MLGSGRSGTSLLAGSLARAGYHVGDDLIPASDANPTGFFEDREVNAINEMLLAQVTPARPPGAPPAGDTALWGPETLWGWRWLAPVPLGTRVPRPAALADRMEAALAPRPFALKDPRFCVTLDAWRPLLPDGTAFLCVFREPARTARSIVRVGAEGVYLHGYRLDFRQAVDLWTLMYQHALAARRRGRALGCSSTSTSSSTGPPAPGSPMPWASRRTSGWPTPRSAARLPRAEVGAEAEALYLDLCRLGRPRPGVGQRHNWPPALTRAVSGCCHPERQRRACPGLDPGTSTRRWRPSPAVASGRTTALRSSVAALLRTTERPTPSRPLH